MADDNVNWIKRLAELGIAFATNRGRIDGLFSKVFDPENNQFRFESLKGKFRSFIRMMKMYFKGQYKELSPWLFIHTAVGLIYLFTNIDLIPDKLYKLGMLDDVAVLLWVLNTYSKEIDKFELWEADHQIQSIELA
jgi:uncharacterized membrane protein YkvA (DUF1232 family)